MHVYDVVYVNLKSYINCGRNINIIVEFSDTSDYFVQENEVIRIRNVLFFEIFLILKRVMPKKINCIERM